jgi:hypothetical protein
LIGTDTTTITYKASHYIYEHNYICRIGAGEYNSPTNPTAVYGSDATPVYASNELRTVGLAYISTVGLYNDENELLAIGRLANPLNNDPLQSLSIKVRFDM